jgi:hypothetical protein
MKEAGSSRIRSLVLLALGAGALVVLAPEEEEATPRKGDPRETAPQSRRADARGDTPALSVFDVARLDRIGLRTRSEQEPKDPFVTEEVMAEARPGGVQRTEPPPPPPPPQAPDLPFRYIGGQEAGGARVLFFAQQQETHIVKVGDVIAGTWRLDEVSQNAATFTYVPLGERKSISLGGPG